MNPHDERAAAEQLDRFLDGHGEPEALSPEEATTARLLMSLAATMEPDPTFARALKQRLSVAPHSPARQGRWLAALRPLVAAGGRLAWAAMLVLTVGALVLAARSLSDAPAGPAEGASSPVAPTASAETEPIPVAPTASVEATAARTPSPLVEAEPFPPPIAESAGLRVDSFSPDGRYVAYWTYSDEALAGNPGRPEGVLRFYNRETGSDCVSSFSPRMPTLFALPTPSLFWLPDSPQHEFIAVLENGRVFWSYPCSDEAADLSERFPETPLHMEPLDGGDRWLIVGARNLWLLEWAPFGPARLIEGLSGLFDLASDGYSVAPDGSRVAINMRHSALGATERRYTTYLLDAESDQVSPVVEWEIWATGDWPGPTWLGNERLLIPYTVASGPLLVTLGSAGGVESEPILSTYFGETLSENERISWIVSGAAEGESFHLVLYGLGEHSALPPVRLYHSETDEVESLPYLAAAIRETGDGAAMLLWNDLSEESAPSRSNTPSQAWLRPFDPAGGAARPFFDGPLDSSAIWSPDGRWVAARSEDGSSLLLLDGRSGALRRRWTSEDAVSHPIWWPVYWSPDWSHLLVQSGEVAGPQRLYLLEP